MAKEGDLFDFLLGKFFTSHREVSIEQRDTLIDFAAFCRDTLKKNMPVGTSPTAASLSLVFQDGTTMPLASTMADDLKPAFNAATVTPGAGGKIVPSFSHEITKPKN